MKPWVRTAIAVGVFYLAAGIVFGALSAGAGSHRMVVAWRLAAWIVSAIAFAAHIRYDQSRLGNPPKATAIHVAVGVAIGAFGLAAAAVVHALTTGTGNLRLLGIALVAWPAITAIPAFLVVLAAATVLAPKR